MNKYWGNDLKDKKIAFVCSGGVTKATAWHLGVSLALNDMGMGFAGYGHHPENFGEQAYVHTYVGSSAGSLIGIWLSEGHNPHDILNAFIDNKSPNQLRPIQYRDMLSLKRSFSHRQKFKKFTMFDHFPSVLKRVLNPLTSFSGIFTTYGLADYLRHEVVSVNDFDALKSDLFIITTMLDYPKKVIFSRYNYPSPLDNQNAIYRSGVGIVDAAAASMSVPPFYTPYPIKNASTNQMEYFIDGEIRETLSTHVAIDNDCDVIISSWTHQPYHFHKDIGSLVDYGLPAICVQSILLLIERKIRSHRSRVQLKTQAIETVYEYMKKEKFSQKHIRNIIEILEQKLAHKRDVRLIDIFPDEKNYDLFFSSTFSLNPKVTHPIVKAAYKKTYHVMRDVNWS